jgi:hypothetical protein
MPKRTPKLFISFVHEDRAVAEAVAALIRENLRLRNVFMSSDTSLVFAGENWLEKIKEAIGAADAVVLMLSRRSVQRAWVNFEAGAAWITDTPMIPVCYGNLSKTGLRHPYSGIQALDLRTESSYLLTSLTHHLALRRPKVTAISPKAWSRLNAALMEFEDIKDTYVTKQKKHSSSTANEQG